MFSHLLTGRLTIFLALFTLALRTVNAAQYTIVIHQNDDEDDQGHQLPCTGTEIFCENVGPGVCCGSLDQLGDSTDFFKESGEGGLPSIRAFSSQNGNACAVGLTTNYGAGACPAVQFSISGAIVSETQGPKRRSDGADATTGAWVKPNAMGRIINGIKYRLDLTNPDIDSAVLAAGKGRALEPLFLANGTMVNV